MIKRNKGLLKALEKTHGILKDYKIEDNPLRGKDSTKWLGKWDRGIDWNKKSRIVKKVIN